MNPNLIALLPAVEPDEFAYLQVITNGLPEDKLRMFVSIYTGKRKTSDTILICCILGFFGAAGIHRFVIGNIGMGILYFFTGGLCLIGTIVDLINHKDLTFEYNQRMSRESLAMVKGDFRF